MQKSPVLLILIAFILGIIVADLFPIHWMISFTLWTFTALSLFLFLFIGRQKLLFKTWINGSIILLFFFSGIVGHGFHQPTSYAKEFSNLYLEEDYLIGEIIDYQIGKGNYDKAILEIEKIVSPYKEVAAQGKLLCYIRPDSLKLSEGDVLLFHPEISLIQNKNNPGEFDAEKYWKVKGIDKISFITAENIEVIGHEKSFFAFWTKAREYLIGLIKAKISEENQGLVIALSLGDKSNLSMETRDHFANAGAMHVLAVSGMHVGILLAFLQFVFKQIKWLRKRNLYLYFALVFLWCFALITGLPASVARAVTMFSILAIGQILGKKFFSLNAIFISGLILLIVNPMWVFDIGFQLSYLAVISIGLFFQPIKNLYRSRYKIVNWLWEGSALGIAAQIGTVPISLYYFNQFPNYFFLSNIGMIIIAGVALNSVVIYLIFHFVPYLSDFIAYCVDLIFTVFKGFIDWINTLPAVISHGFTPSLILVLLLYIGIIFSLIRWNKGETKPFLRPLFLLFVCTVAIIIGRETNKSKRELIVMNHHEKVILLKENRELFILFDEEREEKLTNLDFLISGYENSVGVKAKVVPIPMNNKLQFSKDLIFENKKSGIKIEYYNNKLFLVNKLDKEKIGEDYQIVKGDWNRFLDEEKIDIDVRQRALVVVNK